MAPSGRAVGAVMLVPAALVLTGCDSTFDQNSRAKLVATREIASRSSQQVQVASRQVRVDGVTLLRDRASTAVVVELENSGPVALTDVPVTVGVRRRGERVVLNRAPELPWFQTHVPALAADARATWVFRSPPGRGSKHGDRAFAIVGDPAGAAARLPRDAGLPKVDAVVDPRGAAGIAASTEPTTLEGQVADRTLGDALARTYVRVRNTSGVPQFGLQIVAVAGDGDHPTAAGHATVATLDPGASQTVAVPLTGEVRGPVRVQAFPTIFR